MYFHLLNLNSKKKTEIIRNENGGALRKLNFLDVTVISKKNKPKP